MNAKLNGAVGVKATVSEVANTGARLKPAVKAHSIKKKTSKKIAKPVFSAYDAADYLTDEVTIAAYLNAITAENDPELLLSALKDVANARNMTKLAADAGIARASLYKALSPGAKPQLETILKVAGALGLRMSFQPAL